LPQSPQPPILAAPHQANNLTMPVIGRRTHSRVHVDFPDFAVAIDRHSTS
jgi:hypothetical protein